VVAVRLIGGAGRGAWLTALIATAFAASLRAEPSAVVLLAGASAIGAALTSGRWTPTAALTLGAALGGAAAGSLAIVLLLPAVLTVAIGAPRSTQRPRDEAVDDTVLGLLVIGGAAILGFAVAAATFADSREEVARRAAAQLLALQGVAPSAEPVPWAAGMLAWLALVGFGVARWWRGAARWQHVGLLLVALPVLALLGPAQQTEAGLLVAISALAGPAGSQLARFSAGLRRAALVFGVIGVLMAVTLVAPRLVLSPPPASPQRHLQPVGLLQSAERLAANADAAPWDTVFDLPWRDGPLVVLVWYGALTGMGLAVLPLLALAARPLPDWGIALARPVGLLVCGWLAWLAASIPVAPFTRATILGALATLTGAAVMALAGRHDLRRGLRERWRTLAGWEGVFALSFVAFVVIRALNPDLWFPNYGGEKPMDLAILTAVTRSSVFPPTDPWFAGGALNYYYFGQLLVGTVARLTGIPPEVAYNLGVATLFAMTVTAAASLGSSLAVLGGWPARARFAALCSALFVAVAGNLDLPVQLIGGLARGTGLAFDYWNSSRMMPEQNTITEFPVFTFLFADLHAHALALPLTLVALAFATALASGGGLVTAMATGFVVGALRATNGWDYPTYLGLAIAAAYLPLLRGCSVRRLLGATGLAAVVVVLGWLAFRPFDTSFELFYRWIVASAETTPLHQYLAIHGHFIVAIGSLLILGVWSRLAAAQRWSWGLGIAGIGAAVAVAAGFATVIVVSLLALATLWCWAGNRGASDQRSARAMLALIVGVGLLLGAAVDLVTLAGDTTRTNTVFKFFFQAWTLLAIGAAQAVAVLLPPRRGQWTLPRVAWAAVAGSLVAAALLWPVVATPARIAQRFAPLPPTLDGIAYLSTAVYEDENGPIELRHDREAIDWLRANGGLGSLLEGRTPPARWGARFSVHTGMPAILGWEYHQSQQRLGYLGMVAERASDVDRFYASGNPDALREVIARYRPAFVAVGELEARFYPANGLAAVASLEGDLLEVAYRNPKVTIYRVRLAQP
jgi:YYY domain-containing protein